MCNYIFNEMKKIVIFASGSGTNAENIALYCREKQFATVVAVGTNNSNAKVISRAQKLLIPTFIFDKNDLFGDFVLDTLIELQPDLIVLAGFLLKFPEKIINKYKNKVINIHPALLPKYGGKGMYGMHVHHAVFQNNEKETGITVHYVNENYDEGNIIFQSKTNIEGCQSAMEIAERVYELEKKYFPQVIENFLK